MDVTQVTVQYGRTVSDGGAGSERMVLTLTATKEAHERTAEVVAELGEVAQGLVEEHLRRAGAGVIPDGAGTVAPGRAGAP